MPYFILVNRMVKARLPGFSSLYYTLLAVWPWESYLTSLYFSSLVKWGEYWFLLCWAVVRLSELIFVNLLSQCLAHHIHIEILLNEEIHISHMCRVSITWHIVAAQRMCWVND